MEELINILWKSALSIILFYSFYKVLLQKETFFNSIRLFLVAGLLISFMIPFVIIPRYVDLNPIEMTNYISSNGDRNIIINDSVFDWNAILLNIYFTVTIFLLLRFIVRIIAIFNLIKGGTILKKGGINYIETNQNVSPFSFFSYVVYNRNHFTKIELDQILSHEKVHVNEHHSIDTILANLLTTLQWFNPFAWLYKKEICQNLEYLADKDAHKRAQKPQSYQHLLLKTSIPNYQIALANNFYNSLLKKRIIMLHKQRSNGVSQLKMAFMLPLLMGFIFMFNTKTIAQEKKIEFIEEDIEIFAMGLDNEATKENLEDITSKFDKKGLQVKFKNVKRNGAKIVAISIDAKSKNGKASASFSSNKSEGIDPVQISFDSENNNLTIGNSSKHESHTYSFSTDDDHKKMVVRTKKSKDKHVMVMIDDDDDDDDDNENTWVTKKGTKSIILKVVKEGEDGDTVEETIIEDENGKEITKKIIKMKKGGNDNKFVFISDDDDGKSPMILLNGKEITKKEMEVMDTDSIESINIYKGEKAIEKYGKKAADGVIIITSKKKK